MRARNSRVVCVGLIVLFAAGAILAETVAPSFTGNNSYVLIGTPDVLQIPGGSSLTVEGWVKFTSVSGTRMIYSKNNARTSPYTYMFGMYSTTAMGAYTGAGGSPANTWQTAAVSPAFATGIWYHLAFSYDGTNMAFYRDGELKGTQLFSFTNAPAHTVKLGGYASANDIPGLTSDMRVWNHARTEAQIQAHMARRLTGEESGLLGYWRQDEGAGGVVLDSTANNSTGSLITATWTTDADLELHKFFLAHPVTGSLRFTNTNRADVVEFPEPAGYSHYQITENGAEPVDELGSWTATSAPPTTVEFAWPAEDTNLFLTAWFTNLSEEVELLGVLADMDYTTVAPAMSVQAALTRPIAEGYTLVRLYPADLDTGTTGGTFQGDPIAIHSMTLFCSADQTPGDPTKVTLSAVGLYDVVLTVTNMAGTTASATTQVSVVEGSTRIWDGGGSDNRASTAANWAGDVAPQHGESVLFDDTNVKSCDWDLNIDLLDWTQRATYTGTVTILTRYPGQGSFTNLAITGDCTIEGGVWTHPANSGITVAADRLSVSVGENFVLAAAASINLFSRGFAAGRGPGAGVDAQDVGRGASHGGMGGYNINLVSAPTYGSAARPETLGSGTASPGGGALFLTVGGTAAIDGLIQADGSTASRRAGAAGGSIFVQAGVIAGTGTLRADGGPGGGYAGGGGRIAVVATNSATLGGLTLLVRTGSAGVFGTAGTVYRKTTAGEELIIDQSNRTPQTPIIREYPYGSRFQAYSELPARLLAPDPVPAVGGELEDAMLSISNTAVVTLTSDLRMGDFAWLSSNSRLDLNGYTLFLKAAAPAGNFPQDYGNGTILTNDGRIVWADAGPTVKLDLYAYHGTMVVTNPASPTADDYFDVGTEVTLTVTPAGGYTFLWWKGDLPAGAARTSNPLTVTLNGRRALTPVVASTAEDARTWIGEGGTRNASVAANWYPASAPATGQHVVFDATRDVECYWDLNIEPASWTQTADYRWFYSDAEGHRGFVWIWTRYPGQGAFTNLAIRGNCLLDGGAWVHRSNSGNYDATDRLAVTADGDFRLAAAAMINTVNRGYAAARGPGAGITGQRVAGARGGSHGGLGNYNPLYAVPGKTYGSITAPTTLGSGSANAGGGAVLVHAAGSLTIDGMIRVDSDRGWNQPTLNPGGAAGSIYLQGASVSGAGWLRANGALGYQCGGGGRIALVLTNSTDFADLVIQCSGAAGVINSAAGTIYLEGWSNGAPEVRRLIVDNRSIVSPTNVVTELMPTYETYDPHPSVSNEIENATLEIQNRGQVQLSSSLIIGDFDWLGTNSTINLNGYTLFVKATEPAGEFPADYGTGTVISNEGAIVWGTETVDLPLVVTAGPNGAVGRDPDSVDDMFEYGTAVTLTAYPDPGYGFVFWEGDVPAGSNRTSNPLVVTVDKERTLRALFASTNEATHTWIGDGDNVLASNPTNWYPNEAPTSGVHIVLDATNIKEMHWDLDIEVASWTQTEGFEAYYTPAEGYRGWVVFKTKYPGQGSFTNLAILGDCVLEAGTWTHPVNSGNTAAVDRLSVSVGGNLVLGTNAMIDTINRGFAPFRGPGAGISGQRLLTARGASHGGLGNYSTSHVAKGTTYGSVQYPTMLGSGASGAGGGAVHLVVDGNVLVDGQIRADSLSGNTLNPGGAGGSIYLRGAALAGDGLLAAHGAHGYQCGGGGRIAVVLDNSSGFGDVRLETYGSVHGSLNSAAGTIYLEGRSGGAPVLQRVLIDNNNIATPEYVVTELPPDQDDDPLDWRNVRLSVWRAARAGLTVTDRRLRDLDWVDASARLHLQGHTLYVRSVYHPFTDGDEEQVVVEDGGELIWSKAGTVIFVR